MTLRLYYAARSDVGLLREGNEDAAYAGPHLLAVADGMGGHAHGEVASASAIAALVPLDEAPLPEAPSDALEAALHQANDELRRMVEADPSLEGMGTTLTAMLWTGEQSALVHVGDSRAYLLRDGELYRMTRDHTLVQSLVDEGRLNEEEAATHPQRSLLLRALDGRSQVDPDLSVRDPRAGDRYLLCSDGLCGVVSEETLQETLNAGWDPSRTTEELIELANRAGGPDNITCVVADLVEVSDDAPGAPSSAVVAGAASHTGEQTDDTMILDTSASRAAALVRPRDGDAAGPAHDEHEGGAGGPRPRWRRHTVLLSLLLLVLALGATGYGGWSYARSQYYVGAREGEVVIFRGLSQQVAGKDLSQVHTRTGLPLSALPKLERSAVTSSIPADSLNGARDIVSRLRAEARSCAGDAYAGDRPPGEDRRFAERPAEGNRATRTRPGSTLPPTGSAAREPQALPSPPVRPSPNSCTAGVSSSGG